ncbi:hypothetical protein [uncultured Amphritea sp.]|nr:hypothetical protein [uncultured Amphritea sp.]
MTVTDIEPHISHVDSDSAVDANIAIRITAQGQGKQRQGEYQRR